MHTLLGPKDYLSLATSSICLTVKDPRFQQPIATGLDSIVSISVKVTVYFLNLLTDSDVIYLDLLGTPVVVLNSYTATKALLEKRSTIYSDKYGHYYISSTP